VIDGYRRSFAILAVLGAVACAPARRVTAPSPIGPLRFLLVNDVYLGDTLRDGTAGLARVAYLRDSLARIGPLRFVLAGDVLSPSLLSKWYHGAQMIEQFNAANLDWSTFGNHEFELDRDTLVKRIRDSRFKWTSANCMEANGNPFPGVSKWDTTTVGDVHVGFFGVTLRGDYRRYVKCSDPDSAAHAAIAELRAAGAELVFGLTHQTLEADSALLAREPNLDFILGGHEHEWHSVLVGGRNLIKADANSRSARVLTVARDGSKWKQNAELVEIDRRFPFDPSTQRAVQQWTDSVAKRLGPERVVATTTIALDGRDAASRTRESPLGDLVTDAIRLGTAADVAIMNAGTMRIDDVLPAGPITNYQIESIFLFPDEARIMTFPITGARLRELLERGVAEGVVGKGGYLQVSGIKYSWDATKPSGSRIVGDIMRTDGRAIRPTETVKLSFNVFPACEGGDGYVVPEAKGECAQREQRPRAVDLLVKHIAQDMNGRVVAPAAGRVTRI
jgi:5'-nucleotidase/UDP-sugar diphosphatase